ncbi:MAG: hypothetical protein QG555_1079 [Thermodesulfobacteriota bacterium]|nr:hypothetical protein [Thermodesulfobacteriota bacterium]
MSRQFFLEIKLHPRAVFMFMRPLIWCYPVETHAPLEDRFRAENYAGIEKMEACLSAEWT